MATSSPLCTPRSTLRHEGKGFAAELVAAALDDVRARGLTVIARCQYVARYIREHDEYADLLTV